ncbi:hypothetical protein A2U01_0043520, partial [Trifolium medium]|nr:hypothetical protein [Trifolium medium]
MKRPNQQDINPRLCKRMRLNMPAEENEAIRAELNIQKGRRLGFDNPLTRVGLWDKSAFIMVLGIRNAGKTKFLHMLNR